SAAANSGSRCTNTYATATPPANESQLLRGMRPSQRNRPPNRWMRIQAAMTMDSTITRTPLLLRGQLQVNRHWGGRAAPAKGGIWLQGPPLPHDGGPSARDTDCSRVR